MSTPEQLRAATRRYAESHPDLIRERCKRYRAEHPERVREYERRRAMAHPQRGREYQRAHPEKFRAYARAWAAANREKVAAMNRRYNAANPEKIRENSRKNYRRHPEENALRKAVSHMMRYTECRKTSRSFQYVGCSAGFFRNHIESLFLPGMTWENWGEWHIDHIVPLSWWDLKNHPEHLCVASHYSNLQPMWGKENIRKGARSAAVAREVASCR